MNNNTTAPTYTLRGLQLIGWRDMQHALDYLFALKITPRSGS